MSSLEGPKKSISAKRRRVSIIDESKKASGVLVISASNKESMADLLNELFPLYRALCGADYRASLDIISKRIPLERIDIPSGTRINGWVVPKEFSVREAWISTTDGTHIIDFANHAYHLKVYSQPFDGIVDRETLLSKISVSDTAPDAIPLRQCYYVRDWGFCVTQKQRDALTEPFYHVHIDVDHLDGHLTIGECFLPGESKKEIVLTAYLCHPHGANDNLSGVVVGVELMRLLSRLKSRRFSYRLILNPETIGSLAWIHHADKRRRLSKIEGGFEISICGDSSPLRYYESIVGDELIDRASVYALAAFGLPAKPVKHSFINGGSDQTQFSAPGLRIPFGRWTRAAAGGFKEYHSSADDTSLVTPNNLEGTLKVIWGAIMALERNAVYLPRYRGLPFLSGLGVYPYKHFAGDGSAAPGQVASAYYELLGWADGKTDMITIAMKANLPIEAFDEAASEFERVGLIKRVD